MTANERSEMISRLRMAKDLREQMKIECEQMKIECDLIPIRMDEVTGAMAAAGIEVPGPKKKAGGHTPGAAEMDERIRSGATFAELAAEYGVRECHITKKLRGAGYDVDELRLIAATNAELREAAAIGCAEECAANAPEEVVSEPDPAADRSLMQCMTDAAAALKALRRCIGFGEIEVAVAPDRVSVAAVLCGNLRCEVVSYGE